MCCVFVIVANLNDNDCDCEDNTDKHTIYIRIYFLMIVVGHDYNGW